MSDRKKQIEEAADADKESGFKWHSNYSGNKSLYDYSYGVKVGFIHGAEWADASWEKKIELLPKELRSAVRSEFEKTKDS